MAASTSTASTASTARSAVYNSLPFASEHYLKYENPHPALMLEPEGFFPNLSPNAVQREQNKIQNAYKVVPPTHRYKQRLANLYMAIGRRHKIALTQKAARNAENRGTRAKNTVKVNLGSSGSSGSSSSSGSSISRRNRNKEMNFRRKQLLKIEEEEV